MMRLTVNLARRPAENLRRVRVVWGGALAVLGALFVALATTALVGWLSTRHIQAETDGLRAQIAPLEQAAVRERTPLHDPRVRQVLDRAQMFNQLIARKSISWTRLFERLEEILPPGVELVSLRPMQRNGDNAVDLRLAGESLGPAIDFVRRLEASPDFTQARIVGENEISRTGAAGASPAAAQPRFQLEVTALYRPQNSPAPQEAKK
jgi:Tfp pilus assembly protein PilN